MIANAVAPAGLGLCLTPRQLTIAAASLGLLSAGLVPVFRGPAAAAGFVLAGRVLLGLPWVLAGLVRVFDRPGPQRDWTVAGLLFFVYPSLTVYLDLGVVMTAAETGACPRLGAVVAFNALMVASSIVAYRRTRPHVCPACASRSLIPLARLSGQSRRVSQTRWCASCGGQFWRDRAGAWRVERRTTWVDASQAVCTNAGRRGGAGATAGVGTRAGDEGDQVVSDGGAISGTVGRG